MPKLKKTYLSAAERGRSALVGFIDSRTGRRQIYTQTSLGETIGIRQSQMSYRMTGKRDFTHEELCKIFKLLNPTDEEILSFFGRNQKQRNV